MKRKMIHNRKHGYHFNSSYWQNYKHTLPALPQQLQEIAVGMLLGDASIYQVSTEAYIKFEQGYLQSHFVYHLFDLFRMYCFMQQPGQRYEKRGKRVGEIKSLWFNTFSHKSFIELRKLFYPHLQKKAKKTISPGCVTYHCSARSLAYWIMCDGSLQKDGKCMILHTQGYTKDENLLLSNELNLKFAFHTQVIVHKSLYTVIQFPSQDAALLANCIQPYLISSMQYK